MPILRPSSGATDFTAELDRVNVRDGTAEYFAGGDPRTVGWVMDGHGHIVARYRALPRESAFHVQIPDGETWREIASFKTGGAATGDVAGIAQDGKSLVVSASSAQNRSALFALDATKKEPSVLFADPIFDCEGAIADEWTNRIIGYSFIDDRERNGYFDPTFSRLQKTLEKSFPGRTVEIVSYDVAHKSYIISTDSPQEPLTYYFLDAASMHAAPIGTAYPQLGADALGVMKSYDYKSRDGLDIHGYLTLPPGSTAKNLPLVVMPHGGPIDRDSLRFDWWAQFLANRGYAVFQPNFRGSSGYGEAFIEAGYHEWGRKMQDDITDGVQKLIGDGTADPKRICIVGASYGGYAALAGAAFTPDLYACAVSYAGVSDLDKMLSWITKEDGEDSDSLSVMTTRIGDRINDGDAIEAESPAYHADKIKVPVLLLHASDDTTVPIEQSERMHDKLLDAKKNVEFIAIDGDDHYLDLAFTRIRVLNEIERFLAANIGTRMSAAPPRN